jgi:hypothetical protein
VVVMAGGAPLRGSEAAGSTVGSSMMGDFALHNLFIY